MLCSNFKPSFSTLLKFLSLGPLIYCKNKTVRLWGGKVVFFVCLFLVKQVTPWYFPFHLWSSLRITFCQAEVGKQLQQSPGCCSLHIYDFCDASQCCSSHRAPKITDTTPNLAPKSNFLTCPKSSPFFLPSSLVHWAHLPLPGTWTPARVTPSAAYLSKHIREWTCPFVSCTTFYSSFPPFLTQTWTM